MAMRGNGTGMAAIESRLRGLMPFDRLWSGADARRQEWKSAARPAGWVH